MESIGDAGEVSHSEDEELDRELEKVAATFGRPTSTIEVTGSASQSDNNIIKCESRLTFQFPGWGIDICKGSAITRHTDNTNASIATTSSLVKFVKKCFGEADKPGHGTSVYAVPNEVWMHVLGRLNVRELCCARQTCRWLYNLASQDEAWFNIHEEDDKEDEYRLQSALPRWIKIKSSILSSRIKQKFSYFSKGYVYLRSALNSWWNVGGPDSHYSSKSFHSLICKMTARDWPIIYEAFAVVFSERVDILASHLLTEFRSGAPYSVDACFSKEGESLQCYLSCIEDGSSSKGKSLSSTKDGLLGKEMWQFVQTSWQQYKRWLSLVSTHCQDLNYEVMVERGRSTMWSSTPTVYDKGVICFRNQILLRYKIRNCLQCGLSWMIREDALGLESENLLNAVLHLLQEVDVADDFTLPPKTHTRTILKRSFLLNGVTGKVLP